jgi:hypothetical protein
MHYSVPYNFIKKKVEVRLTDTTVEIFYNHERIASHRRLYGRPGQYATVKDHMPLTHQQYQDWNGDHFRVLVPGILIVSIVLRNLLYLIITTGRNKNKKIEDANTISKIPLFKYFFNKSRLQRLLYAISIA